jgi:hypothetical protein
MKNVTTDEVGAAIRDALELLADGMESAAFPEQKLDFMVARDGDASNLTIVVFAPGAPQTFRVSILREG